MATQGLGESLGRCQEGVGAVSFVGSTSGLFPPSLSWLNCHPIPPADALSLACVLLPLFHIHLQTPSLGLFWWHYLALRSLGDFQLS